MDELYYRKERKSKPLQTWLRKLIRKKGFSYTLIIIIVVGGFLFFGNKGIYHHIQLRNQKEEYILKIQKALEEQRQLKEKSKSLDNDSIAIEKVAREKYGMIREGETVYKVRR